MENYHLVVEEKVLYISVEQVGIPCHLIFVMHGSLRTLVVDLNQSSYVHESQSNLGFMPFFYCGAHVFL